MARPLRLVATALAVVLAVILIRTDLLLGPGGIIALELAWSPQRALEVIGQYTSRGALAAASESIFYDWFFIPCYATAAALWVWSITSNKLVAMLPPVGGLLDGIENFGMLQWLQGDRTPSTITWWSACASVKFVLLAIAAIAMIVAAIKKRSRAR